jgi:hypothetical protein
VVALLTAPHVNVAVTGWLAAPLAGRLSVGEFGLVATGAVGLDLSPHEDTKNNKAQLITILIPRPFILFSTF